MTGLLLCIALGEVTTSASRRCRYHDLHRQAALSPFEPAGQVSLGRRNVLSSRLGARHSPDIR